MDLNLNSGRSPGSWEACYRILQEKYTDMFDKVPEKYGRTILKKGLLYSEFLSHANRWRDEREKMARQQPQGDLFDDDDSPANL